MGSIGAYQVSPPSVETSTPPSLAAIMRFGFEGSIHTSWWSAWWSPLTLLIVFPPSTVFSIGTCGNHATSALPGSTVSVV